MPSPLPDEELLSALRSAAPAPPKNLLERWELPGASVPALRKLAPWALGIAVVALSGIMFAFMPGSPVHPTPTFAQVQEVIFHSDTVSWNERWLSSYILYPNGTLATQPQEQSSRHWADLRLPAIARSSERERRVSRDGQTFQITQKGDSLRTYRAFPSFQAFPWSPPAEKASAPEVQYEKKRRQEIIENFVLPGGGDDTEWSSAPTVLKGRKLLRLWRVVPQQPKPGPWKPERLTYIIWIDPNTRHVFKRETRERLRQGPNVVESVMVCDDFRYNETPPAGLFDVQPPVGSRYVYIPQPVRKVSQEDQKTIEDIVRKAEKAWNAGDVDTYLSLWRFDHPTNGSSREAQLAAIRNPNRYRWPSNNRSYQAMIHRSGVYTQETGATFPPRNPVEFSVNAWGLFKEPHGFKIVRVWFPHKRQRR